MQCQWCFSELRSFRAAENLPLAHWILLTSHFWAPFIICWKFLASWNWLRQHLSTVLVQLQRRGRGKVLRDSEGHRLTKICMTGKNKEKQDLVSLAQSWAAVTLAERVTKCCWRVVKLSACISGIQGDRKHFLAAWDWREGGIGSADPQRAEISHPLCWVKSLPSSADGIKPLLCSLLNLRPHQEETWVSFTPDPAWIQDLQADFTLLSPDF